MLSLFDFNTRLENIINKHTHACTSQFKTTKATMYVNINFI